MAFRDFGTPELSRRRLLRAGAWLSGGAAISGLPLASTALAQQPGAAAWPNVSAMTRRYVAERKVANMVATLGWKQQAPVTIANGTLLLGGTVKADADTLYRIYSMTKPITGMATMMLIDEGKLGLDQPLAEILPEFASMQVLKRHDGPVEDTVPAERPITIRQLLTHTAGLGYNVVQKGPIKNLYERYGLLPGQVSRIPIPGFGDYATIEGLDQFATRLARVPLVYQPGTKWSYSVSLDLLGRVIEVASGVAFDEFLRTRIFEPCGMTSTWFRVPQGEVARFTTNYAVLGQALIPVDPGTASIYLDEPAFPFGGAGLVSSPRDYDRFLMMLAGLGTIEGRQVMTEAAVRLGTSNLLPDGVSTEGTYADGGGFGAGGRVGLGQQAGTYGWGGAAGTVALVNVNLGLRAHLMTQYMPAEAYPVHGDFPKAVLADLAAMQGS